ncbi:aspartate-semialdehyde dehydrogenase [Dialister micraerophilus DSM 19965]|uniref:Aspartate-semialdehyde dehydrogenase n=1 Tax=Dialister micraerophilus DSM 19965 TaxID=888062 RepID=F2BVH1_9FIRM|nr:aspartate-semialdehyde dehydrogenase [Dialister micraerophilus DSM 19965]
MDKKPNIAVLGASGAVGKEFIKLIKDRNFPFNKIKLLASEKSAGTKMLVCGKVLTVEEAKPESFDNIDIAFFCRWIYK